MATEVSKDQDITEPPKPAKVSLLDRLVTQVPPSKPDKKKKIRRKRLELAKKIFNHIREKCQDVDQEIEDELVIFSRFEKPPLKPENPEKGFQPPKVEFDHLELLRPYLNIINEFNLHPIPKRFTTTKYYRKVGYNEYENWIGSMMLNPKDLPGDYRNDIHTIRAGWIPSSNQRTWSQFLSNGIHGQEISSLRTIVYRHMLNSLCKLNTNDPEHLNVDANHWFSLFPTQTKLIHTAQWMDECILSLDDLLTNRTESMVFDPSTTLDACAERDIEKNERSLIRDNLSKLKIVKFNNKNQLEFINHSKLFYISADEYYWPPKRTEVVEDEIYNINIKHSLPALDLQRTFFPTYMDILHLRRWHRPLLSDFHHGSKMKVGTHVVQNLKTYNEESLKIYQEIIEASKSSDIFLMKSMKDLSSLNGHLMLLEYSEQFPILLSQIGMNSVIRIYVNKGQRNVISPNQEYGEVVEVPPNMSPFLGPLPTGEALMVIDNNMFRAPIFMHDSKATDFHVIRNSHGYFIRTISKIFIVGQEHPKIEVPGPNSKAAMRCARERLQSYIFSLFIKSKDNPKRVKIASVRRAFKQHSENSIRKRLKICATYFRQTGLSGKSNWWVLKNDFRLPTYEDMHERIQPEMMCAYYSMLAAQRRLKDAGYGKKSLFMAEEENDDDNDNTKNIDEEILCAPWHTTRAFISSQKGKCTMSVNGFADPTGCGEGFSYVRLHSKGSREDGGKASDHSFRRSRGLHGLDGDLRKLRLNECRQVLQELGVPMDQIDRMQRWDMINRIRSVANTSKNPNVQDIMSKFSKPSRFVGFETSEKYREACQSIFERQNRVLASTQEYSSDEEELDEEDSDIEALTKDLDSLIQTKDDIFSKNIEEEEGCRLDLLRLLEQDKFLVDINENINEETLDTLPSTRISSLLIHRKFIEEEKEFIRTEVVTDPRIINAYLRITKNPNYRQVYAKHDSKTIEELRKEKKRVQDQLRRIKRNQDAEPVEPKVENKEKPVVKSHVRCTACGEIGHMRTNRICPRYIETHPNAENKSPDSDESDLDKTADSPGERKEPILKVQGTKLIFDKSLLEAAEDLNKKPLNLKIPKDMLKRKKRAEDYYCYYYNKQVRNTTSRRRPDPKIYFNAILEEIVIHLKDLQESWPFLQPVCPKKVPDYYTIVQKPMTLLSLRDATKVLKYSHRSQFIDDLKLIEYNSILYNGLLHTITQCAKVLVEKGLCEVQEKDNELQILELEINPLLSDDPQQKMSWIFEHITNNARSLSCAHPFLYPVNSKIVRDYNLFIQKPMDLETIKINASSNFYSTKDSYVRDVDLVLNNCVQYNGPNHAYTKMAHELHDYIMKMLEKESEVIKKCEDELSQNVKSFNSSGQTPKVMDSPKVMESPKIVELDHVSEMSGEAELLEDLQLSEESDHNNDELTG